MKKLKLEMDQLDVASFATGEDTRTVLRGTLHAHADTLVCLTGTETYRCPTYGSTCLCGG